MDSPKQSTGTMVLLAMSEDPELVSLIQGVALKYPSEPDRARLVVQGLIERTLSTSALTDEYGISRPTGLEFFKYELHRIVDGDT